MRYSSFFRLAALVGFTIAVACGNAGQLGMTTGEMAPAQLVINGNYSDERFIDMMAAHHQMAIDMARVEQQKGSRQELKAMAADIIDAQQREIEELKAIKQAHFASPEVPTQMNNAGMENGGMMMPEEMGQQPDVDQAFIDSMLPHHADAIEMATVALRRSGIEAIRVMSRNIIDAQSKEIGQLGEYRKSWYGTQP